jgi:uncharacterized ferritin-like protein (DUF455 family)
MALPASLTQAAVRVLTTADPAEKANLSARVAAAWRSGTIAEIGSAAPPDRPARPDRPLLLMPRDMPRRRMGGVKGRIALLHAVAHIELNAIDLAWDIIARFASAQPRGFADAWLVVAEEEALHFRLLSERLAGYGAAYGDLPAHDGLWQAATVTAHDLLARLAVVPLVLEARGLDVTPAMIERFLGQGDTESADVLRRVYRDEIGHVATGRIWFETLCRERGLEPVVTWQHLVETHFKGGIKPPFNDAARSEAGFPGDFYWPLAVAIGA